MGGGGASEGATIGLRLFHGASSVDHLVQARGQQGFSLRSECVASLSRWWLSPCRPSFLRLGVEGGADGRVGRVVS